MLQCAVAILRIGCGLVITCAVTEPEFVIDEKFTATGCASLIVPTGNNFVPTEFIFTVILPSIQPLVAALRKHWKTSVFLCRVVVVLIAMNKFLLQLNYLQAAQQK